MKISIENLRVHAQVGIYEEEKILGNELEISLSVRTDQKAFLDYSILHASILKAISTPAETLEEIAGRIHDHVIQKISSGKFVVSIAKLQPPLHPTPQRAVVEFEYDC